MISYCTKFRHLGRMLPIHGGTWRGFVKPKAVKVCESQQTIYLLYKLT